MVAKKTITKSNNVQEHLNGDLSLAFTNVYN